MMRMTVQGPYKKKRIKPPPRFTVMELIIVLFISLICIYVVSGFILVGYHYIRKL